MFKTTEVGLENIGHAQVLLYDRVLYIQSLSKDPEIQYPKDCSCL